MRPTGTVLVLLLGAVSASSAAAAGCGSSSSGTTPADAGADTTTAEGGGGVETGADGSDGASQEAGDAAAEATSIPGTNFAFRHYYLGDTDRTGVTSSTAWRQLGTNIDGKVTTATSTDVCTLAAGASKQTQVDGNAGIDNSWGENLLPIFISIFGGNLTTLYNSAVDGGSFTTMIDVTNLTSSPSQSGSAPGWGFAGADLGHPPTWTVADDWPVYPDWLNDGGLASGSKIAFPAASMDGGTWSSGTPTDVPFKFGYGPVGLDLVIHDATVSFTHATPTTAAGGTVSGVLNTQELLTTFGNAAGWLSQSLCNSSAFGSIAQEIQQTQDILHDGTNVAGQPCDGISIGIGFDGVQIGPVQQVSLPEGTLPNICPEAGGD
jgi:hypothetical protein